jgi:hypothetical protein
LVTPGGLALSDSEKAEALADSLEAQFQPVNDPSFSAVIDAGNEAMRAYSFAPASEPKLTNLTKVQDASRGLKFGKAPGPDGIPNRALKLLPLGIVPLLSRVIQSDSPNAVLPGGLKARRRVLNSET